jgi:hypothetical protein
MPASLADALAERLLERLPPTRAYDRPALDEATRAGDPPLPRTVRHFIERMMMRRIEIEQERLQVLRQPWLDYEHEDVRRAEKALVEAVRRHVHVPAEAWERVLRHACGRVAAHLVRPAPTLEKFVFGPGDQAPGPEAPAKEEYSGSDLLPARVVQRRLSYFAAYPYLREAVSAFVEQRDARSFQRERLGALLGRVDERMCAGHDTASWLRLLQPLFALGRAAYPHHDGLPAELLEAFFEEKKADFPLRRLRTARREHDLATLTPSALEEVLTTPEGPPADAKSPAGVAPDRDETSPREERATTDAPPAAAPPEADAPDEAESPDGAEQPPDEASPSAPEETPATPLWKRFAGAAGSEEEETESLPPEAERPADGETARPRWQQFGAPSTADDTPQEAPSETDSAPAPAGAGSASPSASPALTQLEKQVLGPAAAESERARFVRELFDGSEEAYERVLRRLRGAEDWHAATQIIARDVFRAHGVDIYSDPARDFTDAVEARYR